MCTSIRRSAAVTATQIQLSQKSSQHASALGHFPYLSSSMMVPKAPDRTAELQFEDDADHCAVAQVEHMPITRNSI